MLKFSKISLTVLIALVFAGCIFFNFAPTVSNIEIIEAEESVEYENSQNLGQDYQILYSDGYSAVNTTYIDNFYVVFNGTEFIIDVAFVNFNDYSAFTPDTYQKYYDLFDEVSEYFNVFSRGKLEVKFNFYVGVYNSSEYDFINREASGVYEISVIETVIENGVCLKYSGESDAQCLFIGSKPRIEFIYTTKITWPHTYMGLSAFMTVSTNTKIYAIIHETYHMLGCGDLYNCDRVARYLLEEDYAAPLGSTDIMGTGYNQKTPTTANNRERLGWLETSNYEDNISSGIEVISNNGTYTLSNCNSQSGALAFKFGIKGNEWFLAEQRFVGNDSYLIIQRINNLRSSNYSAQNQSELYVLSFENEYGGKYFSSRNSIGTNTNYLYYASGDKANYYINNIKINSQGLVQFDFYNNYSENINEEIESPILETDRNVYVNVKDESGNNLSVSYIQVYSTETNAWLNLAEVSIVYILNQPFYAIFDISDAITKVKIQYTSYNLTSECEFNLIDSTNQYFITLEKNVIQKTGELFSGAKQFLEDAINSFFKLFR